MVFGKEANDFGKAWSEPSLQGVIGGIADTQPDDDGSWSDSRSAFHEVLVLGQDDGTGLQGMGPDRVVRRLAQTDVRNMQRFVAGSTQPMG